MLGSIEKCPRIFPCARYYFGISTQADSLYIIGSGEVEIQKRGRTLHRFKGGDIVGEKLLDRDVRISDAVAVSDCTLYRLRHQDFQKFLFENPEVGVKFLWGGIAEQARRINKLREFLVAVYESGKVVGGNLSLSEMTDRILNELLEAVLEETGGMILILNPFTDAYEIVSESNMTLVDLDAAVQIIGEKSGRMWSETLKAGLLLAVAVRDGNKILGYIMLEKRGSHAPFTVEEEIIVSAVGDQVGLGILNAYHRQEEEARRKLELRKMRRY